MQSEIMSMMSPPPADTTLQKTGQMGTVRVVNQTQTQNISTASSSSKQNNIGQNKTTFTLTNTHGAAPLTERWSW